MKASRRGAVGRNLQVLDGEGKRGGALAQKRVDIDSFRAAKIPKGVRVRYVGASTCLPTLVWILTPGLPPANKCLLRCWFPPTVPDSLKWEIRAF